LRRWASNASAGSACEFPKPLLTIPPVKETKTGPGIPEVTVARAEETFQLLLCVNFLDDQTRLTVTIICERRPEPIRTNVWCPFSQTRSFLESVRLGRKENGKTAEGDSDLVFVLSSITLILQNARIARNAAI
jgi:hypothetical protein